MKIKHPMKTGITHAWLALAVLALTGCGTPGDWEWNVARLHNLENVKGKTFTVVPLRRENVGSAEFKAYATMMATKLAHYGLTYSPTEETGKTDYVVGLDYGISGPQQHDYSNPIYGVVGGESRHLSGVAISGAGAQSAIGQLAQFSGEKTSYQSTAQVGQDSGRLTYYKQYVRIIIFEGRMEPGHLVKRYEGNAVGAAGEIKELAQIVPSGLQALLQEFPGESGKTKLVTLTGSEQTP